MNRSGRLAALVAAAIVAVSSLRGAEGPRTAHVLAVTADGLRWQEVFSGFDAGLNSKEAGGVADPEALARRFDRPTPRARREALLPFLWTVIVRQGQLFGDPSRGSLARVTNRLLFSYPGYNELLAGVADPRIDSNDKRTNPNLTVLEWLSGRPSFRGRVAVFGSWDVLPYIVAAERSALFVNGDGPPVAAAKSDRERLLNEFAEDLPLFWEEARLDAATMQGALEHLRTRKPRVLYVLLGETDEWAHERRYDLYLDAAHRFDRFLQRLWETAQSMPEYRGRTALLVSVDHGRGDTALDWTEHGEELPASERIWIGVMGPDTPALGLRGSGTVTQSQFAATLAALVGEDFRAAVPAVAPPLPGVRGPAPAQ
jgi:hypothetical protein